MQNTLSRPKRLSVRDQIEELIDALNRLYFAGRFDELLEFFELPLPVYMASGIYLQPDREQVMGTIAQLRHSAVSGGATRLQHDIVSLRISGESPVALVHWRYFDAAEEVIGSSAVNYYCRPNPQGRLRVVMVEYLEHSFIGENLRIEPIKRRSATVH